MPLGVFVPGMRLQEGVLVVGARLSFAPVAFEDILAGFDQLPGTRHAAFVDRVRGHHRILTETSTERRSGLRVATCRWYNLAMTETVSDPVSRTRYAFEPDGDDMIVYVWLEPGGALPPHLHPRQTERWSVLEGEVSFQHGDDKRLLTPADGEIPVSPNTKHGLESVGDREARLAAWWCPRSTSNPSSRRAPGGPRRPDHARRDSPWPARRALGGALPQEVRRGDGVPLAAAGRAANADRAAGTRRMTPNKGRERVRRAIEPDYDRDPERFRLARTVLACHSAAPDIHARVARRLLAEGCTRCWTSDAGRGSWRGICRRAPGWAWTARTRCSPGHRGRRSWATPTRCLSRTRRSAP